MKSPKTIRNPDRNPVILGTPGARPPSLRSSPWGEGPATLLSASLEGARNYGSPRIPRILGTAEVPGNEVLGTGVHQDYPGKRKNS